MDRYYRYLIRHLFRSSCVSVLFNPVSYALFFKVIYPLSLQILRMKFRTNEFYIMFESKYELSQGVLGYNKF